jgi:hypothetical protein
MRDLDIWKDVISEAADECSLPITDEQLTALASAVQGTHDNWSLVHYTPPASDHYEHEKRKMKQHYESELADKDRWRKETERNYQDRINSLRNRIHYLEEELYKAKR